MSQRDELRGKVEESLENLNNGITFWEGILEAGREAVGMAEALGVSGAQMEVFTAVITEAEQNIELLGGAKRAAEMLLEQLSQD